MINHIIQINNKWFKIIILDLKINNKYNNKNDKSKNNENDNNKMIF